MGDPRKPKIDISFDLLSAEGFVLVAIMDWHTYIVLSGRSPHTSDGDFRIKSRAGKQELITAEESVRGCPKSCRAIHSFVQVSVQIIRADVSV
jgi:surfactin synthase thioesterase subunit